MQEETEEIKFALLYAQCRKRNKNLEKQVEDRKSTRLNSSHT